MLQIYKVIRHLYWSFLDSNEFKSIFCKWINIHTQKYWIHKNIHSSWVYHVNFGMIFGFCRNMKRLQTNCCYNRMCALLLHSPDSSWKSWMKTMANRTFIIFVMCLGMKKALSCWVISICIQNEGQELERKYSL